MDSVTTRREREHSSIGLDHRVSIQRCRFSERHEREGVKRAKEKEEIKMEEEEEGERRKR